MNTRLLLFPVLFFATVVYSQIPGNLSDAQWESLVKTSSSLSLADILNDPEKFKGRQVIVFGRIGQVDMREKFLVVQQLYQPQSKGFSWKDWDGMAQQGNQPGMRVLFSEWHTNSAATPAGRDRIRDLSGKSRVLGPFDQQRFALVATVDLFSDTFEPYLALIDFRPSNGNGAQPSESATGGASNQPTKLSNRAQAMKAEQDRVNGLDDAIKRQLRDLLRDAQEKKKVNRWKETAVNCENVIIIDPLNQYAHSMAGSAYARLNNFELAEKHFAEATKLMPADYLPEVGMFLVNAKKGETNAALASLELANKKGFPTTYELRDDPEVPDDFKQLIRFKQLTAVSIDRLTSDMKSASSFETRAIDLAVSEEEAWKAVEKLMKDQKETINTIDRKNGLITTKLTSHGLMGGVYESYVIVVEPIEPAKSRVVFKLFTYSTKVGEVGLSALYPASREYIDGRVSKFIESIRKAISKRK